MQNPPAPPHELKGRYNEYISIYGTTYVRDTGWVAQYYRSKSSVKTPGFKTVQNRSLLPWNPFSQSEQTWRYRQGQIIKVASGGTFTQCTGYVYQVIPFGAGPGFPNPVKGVEAAAIMKLRNKIKDSSINIAQSVAERKQALDMMARTVNRLASAVLAVKYGRFGQASSLLGMNYDPTLRKRGKKQGNANAVADNLSRYWLEYQYGWKPLLSDIRGFAELIAKSIHGNRPVRVVSTHTGKGTYNGETIVSLEYGSNGRIWEEIRGTHQRKVRHVVEFEIDSATLATLGSTGITDPALLAWELLPYSFVVDWFIPVGDYISSLSATQGLTFKRGSQTVVDDFSMSTEVQSTTFYGTDLWVVQKKFGKDITGRSKTRTILNSFPLPPLPSPEPYVGAIRALSGIALINQAFGNVVQRTRWNKIPSRFHY